MAFTNVLRAASRVVPSAVRASTGRQWYLRQHCSLTLSAVVNRRVGDLGRNLLGRSLSPSFLHHYSTKTSFDDESLPGIIQSESQCAANSHEDVQEGMTPVSHHEELYKRIAMEACSPETRAKMDALEKELSKIAGLHELKSQIRKWAKGMLLDEKRRALGLEVGDRRPPHMAFLGNPGTGKTMVARVLGKLLHMVGILPTDRVKEVHRTDLVAKYVGQTGLKTRRKIREAEGGILFVDEAYRLVPNDDSSGDFGIEALEEIMSFMESGKIVVIFAGYIEPMVRVMSSNEGFRRRVTKLFHFDDFSCEDIAEILRLKMSGHDENSPLYGFKLHPSCSVEAVAAMLERETTETQRREMNGGLADIMLENAKENLDMRTDFECIDTDSLLTITLEDLAAGLPLLATNEARDQEGLSRSLGEDSFTFSRYDEW